MITTSYHRIAALAYFFTIMHFASLGQMFSQKDYGHQVIMRNQQWENQIVKILKIGDTIPQLALEQVQNWPSANFKIPVTQKKLTVIEFWSITCTACINSIPNNEKMQAEFGDKLQILMVTRDNANEVEYTKTKADYLKNCRLPMYNDDKYFHKYFVFKTVPQMVWVDNNGVILAMGTELLDRSDIKTYLQHHRVPGPQNNSVFFDFDRKAPSFVEGSGRNFQKVRYFSVIMDTINGLGANDRIHIERDSLTHQVKKLLLDNVTLLYLWRLLLIEENNAQETGKLNFVFDKNRTKYEINDSSVFYKAGINLTRDDRPKLLCYELMLPDGSRRSAVQYMREDLERFTSISSDIEYRNQDCWVIEKLENSIHQNVSQNILSNASSDTSLERSLIGYNEESKKIIVKNTSVDNFLDYLQYNTVFTDKTNNLPIIISDRDSVSIREFNLVLNSFPNNGTKNKTLVAFEDLKIGLRNYGFGIVRQRVRLPMMIVKDIK